MNKMQYRKLEIFPRIPAIRRHLMEQKLEDTIRNVPDSIAGLFTYGSCRLKDLTPYCIQKLKDQDETVFAPGYKPASPILWVILFFSVAITCLCLIASGHYVAGSLPLAGILIPVIVLTIIDEKRPLKRGFYLYDRFLFSIYKNTVSYYELGCIQCCNCIHCTEVTSFRIRTGEWSSTSFCVFGDKKKIDFNPGSEEEVDVFWKKLVLRRCTLFLLIQENKLTENLSKLFIVDSNAAETDDGEDNYSNNCRESWNASEIQAEPATADSGPDTFTADIPGDAAPDVSDDNTENSKASQPVLNSEERERLSRPGAEITSKSDFDYLLQLANSGDAVAQYNIGLAYERGTYCGQSSPLGMFYLKNAADKNQRDAIRLLSKRKDKAENRNRQYLQPQEICQYAGSSVDFEKLPPAIQRRLIWRQILKENMLPENEKPDPAIAMAILIIVNVVGIIFGVSSIGSELSLAVIFLLLLIGTMEVGTVYIIIAGVVRRYRLKHKKNALQTRSYLTPLYLIDTTDATITADGSVSLLLPLVMITQVKVTYHMRNYSYTHTEVDLYLNNGNKLTRRYDKQNSAEEFAEKISDYRKVALQTLADKNADILKKYDDFGLYSLDLLSSGSAVDATESSASNLEIRCPHCGTEFEVDAGNVGAEAECTECGASFIIGANAPESALSPSPLLFEFNAICPYCRAGYVVAAETAGTETVCSVCGKKFTITADIPASSAASAPAPAVQPQKRFGRRLLIGGAVFLVLAGLVWLGRVKSMHWQQDKRWQEYTCNGILKFSPDRKTLISCTDKNIRKIAVPAGCTAIGKDAFKNCGNLTDAVIPAGVVVIGESAFAGCKNLTGIAVPAGVTEICDGTFSGCTKLSRVTLPDSVVVIGRSAFAGCENLIDIAIPYRVAEIRSSAFAGCTHLSQLTLPVSTKKIGQLAFAGCRRLVETKISPHTSIEHNAFAGCPSIIQRKLTSPVRTEVTQAPRAFLKKDIVAALHYRQGPFTLSRDGTLLLGCDRNADIVIIPEGVKKILLTVFMKHKNLISVTIPGSVAEIGKSAFSDCENLTEVIIKNGVRKIESYAFRRCSNLTKITIPDSVISIGDGAFAGCLQLAEVQISDDTLGRFTPRIFGPSDMKPKCYDILEKRWEICRRNKSDAATGKEMPAAGSSRKADSPFSADAPASAPPAAPFGVDSEIAAYERKLGIAGQPAECRKFARNVFAAARMHCRDGILMPDPDSLSAAAEIKFADQPVKDVNTGLILPLTMGKFRRGAGRTYGAAARGYSFSYSTPHAEAKSPHTEVTLYIYDAPETAMGKIFSQRLSRQSGIPVRTVPTLNGLAAQESRGLKFFYALRKVNCTLKEDSSQRELPLSKTEIRRYDLESAQKVPVSDSMVILMKNGKAIKLRLTSINLAPQAHQEAVADFLQALDQQLSRIIGSGKMHYSREILDQAAEFYKIQNRHSPLPAGLHERKDSGQRQPAAVGKAPAAPPADAAAKKVLPFLWCPHHLCRGTIERVVPEGRFSAAFIGYWQDKPTISRVSSWNARYRFMNKDKNCSKQWVSIEFMNPPPNVSTKGNIGTWVELPWRVTGKPILDVPDKQEYTLLMFKKIREIDPSFMQKHQLKQMASYIGAVKIGETCCGVYITAMQRGRNSWKMEVVFPLSGKVDGQSLTPDDWVKTVLKPVNMFTAAIWFGHFKILDTAPDNPEAEKSGVQNR